MLRLEIARQRSSRITTSKRVINLAEQINAWHDTRPVPERWQPVMLGRMAALFGVTRELMAAGMQHAGWKEKRTGTASMWEPQTTFKTKGAVI